MFQSTAILRAASAGTNEDMLINMFPPIIQWISCQIACQLPTCWGRSWPIFWCSNVSSSCCELCSGTSSCLLIKWWRMLFFTVTSNSQCLQRCCWQKTLLDIGDHYLSLGQRFQVWEMLFSQFDWRNVGKTWDGHELSEPQIVCVGMKTKRNWRETISLIFVTIFFLPKTGTEVQNTVAENGYRIYMYTETNKYEQIYNDTDGLHAVVLLLCCCCCARVAVMDCYC